MFLMNESAIYFLFLHAINAFDTETFRQYNTEIQFIMKHFTLENQYII